MNTKHLFDYTDYRKYLEMRLPTSGLDRGSRSKLAHDLKCQTAFVSQVLHGDAHFSLEHGVKINRFLKHTENESEYFLLLLQLARAGTKEVEDHFLKKIFKIQEKRRSISEKFYARETLTGEHQAKYYGTWYYAAIHMLLLVPQTRTAAAIAAHLGLPATTVAEVLEFLSSVGLAIPNGNEFLPGKARIHLTEDSDLTSRHHANWKLQAIRAEELHKIGDFFFAGPISVSVKDAEFIRVCIQKLIAQIEPVIQESKDETVYCINLDFFKI